MSTCETAQDFIQLKRENSPRRSEGTGILKDPLTPRGRGMSEESVAMVEPDSVTAVASNASVTHVESTRSAVGSDSGTAQFKGACSNSREKRSALSTFCCLPPGFQRAQNPPEALAPPQFLGLPL